MNKWKIKSQKTIFIQRFFKVKTQEILLPNGKKRKYSIVERRPISVIFPASDKLELYLISQFRHLFNKKILEAVAGHIDTKETPLGAARRELKEETGITASSWREILEFETSASVIKSNIHMFLAKGIELGVSNPEEGEEIELVKMSIEEAIKKIMDGEIRTASTIIGVFLLDKLNKEGKL
ncbi:MAG: hypothetical protein A3B44_02935 [Candidatus Levybacteria bacterium RIFCSPLOWO2_01_FULL_38_21]|nr:MAG: hypothetical protein A3B44_02935 [Candidatus Levybacteria bacterium RIFCSPLOWO2_01_FULL_38_21]